MVDSFKETKNGFLVLRNTPERWEELKRFPLSPGDVFIVTYPRSGTTWMQQIVKLLRNGGQPNHVTLDRAIPWLEVLDSDFGKLNEYTPDMATSSDVLSPRAFKSHLPYELVPGGLPHATTAKYIYVMRNPKDVCVSRWHHLNKIQTGKETPWDDFLAQMFTKKMPFAGWFDHVLGWWKHRDSPNILYIMYEDMKRDPLTAIHTVANFIGVEDLTEKLVQDVLQNSSFANMKKDPSSNYKWLAGTVFQEDYNFIRKGEIGGWKEQFSEEQNKSFDELFAERMSGSDLTFQFE